MTEKYDGLKRSQGQGLGNSDTALQDTDSDEPTQKTAPLERADALLVPAETDLDPTLSVVMPTLNEEDGIEECMTRLKRAIAEIGVPTEIVVSDSSSDRTPEIAADMGAIVVEPDDEGYGYAYQYAFERARGDVIAMGDADTTYDFEELPKLIERLIETDADMVLGSRLDGEIKPGAMPNLHQYVGNPLLTRFLNVFYGAGVSDAHSGFRVFTKSAFEELDCETDGMEFASEMIMEASAKGHHIAEVPITYHPREGEATLDSFRDGWRHVKFMLQNAPGYLFSLPGAALVALGTVIMTAAFFSVEITTATETIRIGLRSMVVGSLLTIAGYQVVSLGVFSTVTSDPIRRPTDRITTWLVENLTLARGGVVGLVLFAGGGTYAGYLVYQWLAAGYQALPMLTHDILAFTLIVLGVQTVFTSFFMSVLTDSR